MPIEFLGTAALSDDSDRHARGGAAAGAHGNHLESAADVRRQVVPLVRAEVALRDAAAAETRSSGVRA